jgi:hypothetical protein
VINATNKQIDSQSEVEIDFVDESAVKYPAAPLVIGTTNIALEPHADGRSEVTCTLAAAVHVARFFGHTHSRGKQLTVSQVSNGNPENPFYSMDAWDNPRIIDDVDITAGETVSVGCDFQNEGDKKLGYPGEMCQAGGFYWPANGALVCMSWGADPKCNCIQPVNAEIGPGGKTVTLEVSRAATIVGAKGDLSEGRPIYCYAYRKADMDKDGPLKAKIAYWSITAADAKPLASETDSVQMTLQDVTSGDYVATCAMDSIYGGFFPGTGSPIVYPYVSFTIGDAATTVKFQLNFAKP